MEERIKKGTWLGVVKKDAGGQGQVYFAVRENWIDDTMKAIQILASGIISDAAGRVTAKVNFAKALFGLLSPEARDGAGALKVLHGIREGRGFTEKEMERLRAEVKAMETIKHPSLVRILDSNPDEGWYVSEYFHAGTLDNHASRFRGAVRDSLGAFRRLVEGVAQLHVDKRIHRDIKPANIFVDPKGGLVLGDFGLVYFQDDERARVTDTLENVGSRYWMPPWAEGMRIDDVRPSMDVYSLGKVLWSMVSGKPRLVREGWDEELNDVTRMFPDDPHVSWINWILTECVRDEEKHVLKDASELLTLTDRAIRAVSIGGQVTTDTNVAQLCSACGIGKLRFVESPAKLEFHWEPKGYASSYQKVMFKVARCDHCRNIMMFATLPSEEAGRVFG